LQVSVVACAEECSRVNVIDMQDNAYSACAAQATTITVSQHNSEPLAGSHWFGFLMRFCAGWV